MQLLFTTHSRQRMYERKISPEEVKHAVAKGMKWFVKSEGEKGRWHAKMGAIEVIFERDDNLMIIVTVF